MISTRPHRIPARALRHPPAPKALPRHPLQAARIARFYQACLREQNPIAALAAGVLAMATGVGLWGLVPLPVVLAPALGWGVGRAVRLGRGIAVSYGLLGGALALIGCLAGNLLAAARALAAALELPVAQVLSGALGHPYLIPELFALTFHPLDALLYLAAAAIAYHSAFRQLSALELSALDLC